MDISATKRSARIAGLLYILTCFTAPFALIYVPNKIIVRSDPAATASNLRASAHLLRLGIADEILVTLLFIFVVMALYRLFKPVDQSHSLAMAALYYLSVPISLFAVLPEFGALAFATGAYSTSSFQPAQLDALAFLCMRLHSISIYLAEIFWGLWLFPFGVLVIRSRFIPQALGYFLFLAGVAYLASASTSLFFPHYAPTVGRFATIGEAGELPIILWLLIWGAKPQSSQRAAAA